MFIDRGRIQTRKGEGKKRIFLGKVETGLPEKMDAC